MSAWLTNQGQELWYARNKTIYDKEDTINHMEKQLNMKIRQLYELQNSIGYHDRDIFSQPIEDRLSLSAKQKMNWIEQTTKTMKISSEDYEDKQTSGQRDIRQFFSHKQSTRKN